MDVLLENAGVMTAKWQVAEEDELQGTTNVTSTFLLGLLLLPKMSGDGCAVWCEAEVGGRELGLAFYYGDDAGEDGGEDFGGVESEGGGGFGGEVSCLSGYVVEGKRLTGRWVGK